MKKIYNSPAIETTEIYFASLICDGSPGGGEIYSGGLGKDAPKPKTDKPF